MSIMVPTALLFSRYRAFKDEVRLPLAPLTIIIGRNGSGKSLLTRLPLLLSSGLSRSATAPLDLVAGGITHATRFEDLIHLRSAQPFMLGAEISRAEGTFSFRTTLRYVVENHTLGYEAFELCKDGSPVVSLTISGPDQIGRPSASFIVSSSDTTLDTPKIVEFLGLFPVAVEDDQSISQLLSTVRTYFEQALHTPSYLGPFRSESSSSGRIAQQGIQILGPRGEGALDILGDNSIRSDGMITSAVEEWFDGSMDGSRIKLELNSGIPRVLVYDAIRNLDIDMSETGAGFAQVLPIVVQLISRYTHSYPYHLSIVEQPELHLHPGAHGGLADLFVTAVSKTGSEVRYICETHSEQFITRVRRRVAEGQIDPGDVTLISVAHQTEVNGPVEPIRTITIDSYGNTDSWPIGVFDEAFNDLVLIREAAVRAEDTHEGGILAN